MAKKINSINFINENLMNERERNRKNLKSLEDEIKNFKFMAASSQNLWQKRVLLAVLNRYSVIAADMPFCPSCGSQIGEGVRFCPACGSQAGGAANGTPSASRVTKVTAPAITLISRLPAT